MHSLIRVNPQIIMPAEAPPAAPIIIPLHISCDMKAPLYVNFYKKIFLIKDYIFMF